MCSIVGSFSKDTLRGLLQLNAYRGIHSYSFFVFSEKEFIPLYSRKGMGSLDLDEYEHDIPEGYYIAHQQAPTTENKDIMSVHPAEVNKELLWHNGIIKEDEVARLQQLLDVKYTWDTKLLLLHLIKYQNVDNIDGSFSCVYHDKKSLFLFRNEISPLFYDRRSNISSTKFKDSMSLPPNQILKFIPNIDSRPDLEFVTKFTTKENPYFFIEGV